jgi:hypothetical protein
MNFLNFFAEVTRDHCDLRSYDHKQVAGAEYFRCLDCHRVMLLTTRGCCGVCGSSAVEPESLIERNAGIDMLPEQE